MTSRDVHGVGVRGVDVGPETRCAHYDGPSDVIAIRFPCCDRYYPCAECHEALADHEAERRSAATLDDPAILCGVCGAERSWREYLGGDLACPTCGASFNPGCARHYDRYLTPGAIADGDAGASGDGAGAGSSRDGAGAGSSGDGAGAGSSKE
ncbi:MAG: CHY zinc finger protein [Haloferacaceae archaeon]